MINAWRR